MSFLLDSDICSAHLRRPRALFHRFMQHGGQLWISTITLSDLYTWAFKQNDPTLILAKVHDFLRDVQVLPFDEECALELGKLRGTLLRQGIIVSPVDLMIGSIALVHDLTLVTHNTSDFRFIPGLRLDDWLTP
ncbi:MAG TPA: type II toxin-antitoxin system VapC family toxin [Pirellulales bacterium]|nr:type II toxin-antitoxin system VapC family toxin [Pirellulales bacterium]